ncbi:probable serine/threonine-protein kinase PBL7 [Papaver somniferum]|uniref:probable serine/threonine-protein kinase PBL7 n=1 Tax=Papaver somniferum TaxID=3469 RepID=UPI000E6F9E23|nr:probable serine/threonine-protein kinase PBL7 [Papaver somniferum]
MEEKWKPGRKCIADDSEREPLLSQEKKDGDSIKLQKFTFKELESITNNFSEECKLDKDWFGCVYRGRLGSTGQVVAVKRLAKKSQHQENIDYVKELQRFSLLNHLNLINLIGYCDKGDNKFLVYELTTFGSLQEHLHDLSSKREPLDWNTSMKIAVGVAKGLEYLHHKAKPTHFTGIWSHRIYF